VYKRTPAGHPSYTSAATACLGALFLWSLGPIFNKQLAGFLDSWTQNALRYSVAFLFWLPYLLLCIRKKRFDRQILRKAVAPSIANVLLQSCWAATFYYMNPAFAVLLTKTSVLWIVAFSLVLLPQERRLLKRKRLWLCLMLCITGVMGVMWAKEDFSASGSLFGIALALSAAFFWGLYTVSIRISFRDTNSLLGFSIVSLYTSVGLWLAALCVGQIGACLHIGWRVWALLILSAATSIALAHVCYYAAIKRLGATIPALVILVQPFLVLLMSRFFFNERLNIVQLLFGIILISGAALTIGVQKDIAVRA
jgi:drug/metabolite transporter (DMT)-like permease